MICISYIYVRFTRMSPERFYQLLELVAPHITKKLCRSRNAIPAAERLLLTLRYLAAGESQQSLSFSFRIGRSTVSNIVRETCEAIWNVLKKDYLKAPSSTNEWVEIANGFYDKWNFPNCLGAIDGKHVMIECPKNAGSAYYNYKNFHSIVLLATCDANYCFTLVDIGSYGSTNDASVLSKSIFGKAFDDFPTNFNIPAPSTIGERELPYVLIGDDIFPLKPWLMKPFPGKNLQECQDIFNYRLSRARRVIENAFGILAAKWRIFRRPIKSNVNLVENIVKATVCLHNYLRLTENASYTPQGFVDSEDISGNIIPGDWRNSSDLGFKKLRNISGNRYTNESADTRLNLMEYFNNEGSVPWQLDYVRRCGRAN